MYESLRLVGITDQEICAEFEKRHPERVTQFGRTHPNTPLIELIDYAEQAKLEKFLKGRASDRRHHTKRNYGKSDEDYDRVLNEQNGCALCHSWPRDGQRFHWDHDHSCCPSTRTCGKCIRGLLCPGCNTGLGKLEKILETLTIEQLLEYANGRLRTQ